MQTIYGIDVSKYQGKIDWDRVKAAGKDFVFVRLGWAGWNGELSIDSMAAANIEGAKKAGLSVGVYVYSYCKTAEAAKTAARGTIEAIARYAPLPYPVAFDIEDTSDTGTPYHRMGKTLNAAIAAAFLGEVERNGWYGILYTYKSFAENYLDMAALKNYDVWIAQYAAKCTWAGAYGIWQYAGDNGLCDGVAGACDLNVSYRDYASIIRSAKLNGYGAGATGNGTSENSSALTEETAALRQRVRELEAKLRKIAELSA